MTARDERDSFSGHALLERGAPLREALLAEHAADWSSDATADKVAALDDRRLLCLTVACWTAARTKSRAGVDDAADLWLAGICERQQAARLGDDGEQVAA